MTLLLFIIPTTFFFNIGVMVLAIFFQIPRTSLSLTPVSNNDPDHNQVKASTESMHNDVSGV